MYEKLNSCVDGLSYNYGEINFKHKKASVLD